MFHPLGIDNPEHHESLQDSHLVMAYGFLALFIGLYDKVRQQAVKLRASLPFQITWSDRRPQYKRMIQSVGKGCKIPFFLEYLFICVNIQYFSDNLRHHLKDPLFQAFSLYDFTPVAVDDFTLLIHDIVVFKDLFPDVEVVTFNSLLCRLDGPGNTRVLNWHILFPSEAIHYSGYHLSAEQPHKVIFKRDIELGRTGVSLPT